MSVTLSITVVVIVLCRDMAEGNGRAIVEALAAMAQAMQAQQNPPVDEFRSLSRF